MIGNPATLFGLDRSSPRATRRVPKPPQHQRGELYEHELAGEEVLKGLEMSLVKLACSIGSWMFRPIDGLLPK